METEGSSQCAQNPAFDHALSQLNPVHTPLHVSVQSIYTLVFQVFSFLEVLRPKVFLCIPHFCLLSGRFVLCD
jgi:hypothetical protein